MDYKIIAVSVLGTHPIPVKHFAVRIYGQDKRSLLDLSVKGATVEVILRYRWFAPGASAEVPRMLKIQWESNASSLEVVSFQDPNDEKLGKLFCDLGSGQSIIYI